MEFQLHKKCDHIFHESEIEAFEDTRLCIIDEISFGGYNTVLEKLNDKLGKLTRRTDLRYGRSAIVFLGDFCQLPSFGECIYEKENSILWEQALNCMVELKGAHRFKHCEFMRRVIPEMRESGLKAEDRAVLNSRLVDGENIKLPEIGKAKFVTWKNITKSEFNAAVFKDYLRKHHSGCTKDNIPKSAVVLKAGARWAHSGAPLSFAQKKILYEECPEGVCRDSERKYYDPFLCLFYDCQLMCNRNKAVDLGIANGTTALFKKVHLMSNAELVPIQVHGYWVYSVDMKDVDCLEMEFYDMEKKGRLKLCPLTRTVRVPYPALVLGKRTVMTTGVKLYCMPILLNYATTGHKVQGKSMDEVIIVEWSTQNAKRWAYVVISRARTLNGVFFLEPIPEDIDFCPDEKYTQMMERLRQKIGASPEDIADLMEEFIDTPYFRMCEEHQRKREEGEMQN
jgi:hypothetical protein